MVPVLKMKHRHLVRILVIHQTQEDYSGWLFADTLKTTLQGFTVLIKSRTVCWRARMRACLCVCVWGGGTVGNKSLPNSRQIVE